MLALDPDPGGKVVPVPRRLAAPRANLRVERAHRSAHRGTGFEGLRSERPAGQLRFYAQSLAPTLRLDVDRVTDRPLSQSVHEVRDSAEGAAPERREDVANLETPGLRRRSGRDLREEHALAARDAVVRRDPAVDIVARDAEPGPLNVSVFEDLARDAERRVDRNRKPDTLGERNRRRVDRHDASLQIDERTSAVPRIHRGVRLDHGKAVPRTERQVAPQRTDHAGGDRRAPRKAERVPNRQHGLADLELVGVRELRRVEVFPVDLDDRNVRLIVSADDGPAEDAAVREGHDHLARSVDHVMRREDVALTIEEDSGAEASTRPRSPERRTVCSPAVLTLTVLAPTRSTALMYAFCKSAIMETDKTSAGFVERVPTVPVTGQGPRRKTCRSTLAGRMEGPISGTAPSSTRGVSRSRTRRPPRSRSGRGSIPAGSAGRARLHATLMNP